MWNDRKGITDFIKLRQVLPADYEITLVGLNEKQISVLPAGIKGISRTQNIDELVKLYNEADVYVNTSKEETLGMTTIEALSCGTPAIVYNCTACAEPLSQDTGFVVDDFRSLSEKIRIICEETPFLSSVCRDMVLDKFDKRTNFKRYLELYKSFC